MENIITKTNVMSMAFPQQWHKSPTKYAKRLMKRALRCRLYNQYVLEDIIRGGLLESIYYKMRSCWVFNKDVTILSRLCSVALLTKLQHDSRHINALRRNDKVVK